MHTGRFAEAMGILLEAMNIYQQVYGAIHEDLGTIFRLLARIHFLMEDMPQAISYQKKATVVCERALGIDHPETIVAYVHLGLYCQSAGQVSIALRLMYRARYLTLLAYGEGHPDLATIDTNIGLMLHGLKEYKPSLRFLQSALRIQIKYKGEESVPSAMGYHLVARALVNIGEVQQAIQEEKKAFNLYLKLLGPDDVRTKGSRDCVRQLTRVAVEMQQKMNATRTQQDHEITADQELLMSFLHHFNHPRMEPVVDGSGSAIPIPPSAATILEIPDEE
jgi:protein TIF31